MPACWRAHGDSLKRAKLVALGAQQHEGSKDEAHPCKQG